MSVWSDALCINQSDIEERDQRVSIMGHIHSRMSRVVVWLGSEEEEDVCTLSNALAESEHKDVLICKDDRYGRVLETEPYYIWSDLVPGTSLSRCAWFGRTWTF
jgi:hypothetical protein